MYSTSRNKSSSLVLKPCKSVQETSEELLFIKARQIDIYRSLMLMLGSCSTEIVSIKNYEIQISRSVFMHIRVYLRRVFFLTTLDIYKDYFKGHLKWCKVIVHTNCDWRHFVPVHHILSRSYCVFALRVLWPRSFLVFIVGWTEELCSQHLLQVGVLVTYLDPCINW